MQPAIEVNNGVVCIHLLLKNMLLYHPYTEPETACPEFRLNLLKMT